MTGRRVRVEVRVRPRSRHPGVRLDGEIVRVGVSAAPDRGRATEAMRRALADALGVPVTAVGVVMGHKSRTKLIEIDGIDHEQLLARLGGSPP